MHGLIKVFVLEVDTMNISSLQQVGRLIYFEYFR